MVQEQTQTLQGGISVLTPIDYISNFRGAYFDIINDHTIDIQNQITDNYLENNTAIQDHIAHSPIMVTVSGIVGELVYEPAELTRDNALESAQKSTKVSTLNKLSQLTSLLPPVSNAMQIARNLYDYGEASVNRYIGIVKSFSNSNNGDFGVSLRGEERISKLNQVFKNLLELRNNNIALTVETPFDTFENMYIQSLTFKQGNENYIGDISITLKQLRFADTTTTKADEKVMSQYNAWARANVENNGKAQGKSEELSSILYSIKHPKN